MNEQECSRYRSLVRGLVRDDPMPDDARPLAAARVLWRPDHEMAEAPWEQAWLTQWRHVVDRPEQPLRDDLGHSRPVYRPLALHLPLLVLHRYQGRLAPAVRQEAMDLARRTWEQARMMLESPRAPGPRVWEVGLWWAWVRMQAARVLGEPDDVTATTNFVDHALAATGDPVNQGALHPLNPEESLDGWTFAELTALHALAHLARAQPQRGWAARVTAAARYHGDNSQPDNTTTQPWGWIAFVASPDTRSLADQQLHDLAAQTQLNGRTPWVTALLLADLAAWVTPMTS